MHEVGGFTEDLDGKSSRLVLIAASLSRTAELLDKARPAMLHRRKAAGPPLPGALVTATKEAIWKLGIFSQRGLHDLAKKEIVAVFLGEGTFYECFPLPPQQGSGLTVAQVVPAAGERDEPARAAQHQDAGGVRSPPFESVQALLGQAEALSAQQRPVV